MSENSNHLAGESSLYLQQHAHNPVNWYPWSDAAWTRAKNENKLVIISIGYSSCHWCHVMERETFEDTAAARLMNENFICIKVDREERPDVDQIYMSAVQLMTGSGGWPLNCITLPNAKPIYGGTYFPKQNWMNVLTQVKEFYKENQSKANQYADELLSGINQIDFVAVNNTNADFDKSVLKKAVEGWKPYLDNVEGGPARTPKFPLPTNYAFLLRYSFNGSDEHLLDHVNLTLTKMAFGGIYDQIAGGFSRYSTDSAWKIPHFEKMLYDNAQLVALYSAAYKLNKNELYKDVVAETVSFLKDEMSNGNGGYYSAIDADSEGEEGKYYVWTVDEIRKMKLPSCGNANSFEVLSDYYNLNDTGHWEHGNYILLRKKSDQEIAASHKLTTDELKTFISQSKTLLRKKRSERMMPAIDKKIITSWNALHISALCEAYEAFGEESFRNEAILCANHILSNAEKDEKIIHVASHKNEIGFLEDYAFTISAFINLYQATFDEKWLAKAKTLTEYTIANFYDAKSGFFWYTESTGESLIAKNKETTDNVIPSSNSEMANALYMLGEFYDESKYSQMSEKMLMSVQENFQKYLPSYCNWANLMINHTHAFNEIVITGDNAHDERKNLSTKYLPNTLFAGSKQQSSLSLLENRFTEGKTLIYVCSNKTCKLPVESGEEAYLLIK